MGICTGIKDDEQQNGRYRTQIGKRRRGTYTRGFILGVCLDEAVDFPHLGQKLSPPPHLPLLWPPSWVRLPLLQATGGRFGAAGHRIALGQHLSRFFCHGSPFDQPGSGMTIIRDARSSKFNRAQRQDWLRRIRRDGGDPKDGGVLSVKWWTCSFSHTTLIFFTCHKAPGLDMARRLGHSVMGWVVSKFAASTSS